MLVMSYFVLCSIDCLASSDILCRHRSSWLHSSCYCKSPLFRCECVSRTRIPRPSYHGVPEVGSFLVSFHTSRGVSFVLFEVSRESERVLPVTAFLSNLFVGDGTVRDTRVS